MATKIPIGTSSYFTDFDGGQGGGASNYFTYAADQDTNFLLLRTTINQMIDEISAVSGPNATIALDLVRWDDDENPIDSSEPVHGVIGPASYEVSVEGGGTLKVRKGQVLVNLQKNTLVSDLTGLTSSGGAGTRYVALDANGQVFIESAADQRSADLATVTWDGAQFTAGTVVHLLPVLFDGDSWAECQDRAVTPDVATLAAYTFRRVASRIRALELFLSGHSTGEEGEAIAGPIALLPGAVGAPALILGDGSSTWDSSTGWYRQAAGVWGFSGAGTLILTLGSTGLVMQQLGTVGTPIFRHFGGSGFYFLNSGNEIAVSCEGGLVFRCKRPTSLPQLLIADGSAAAPSLGFDQDEDTGFYSPATAEVAMAIAGAKAFHWTAAAYRMPDGAVGAPVLTFESDLDTGLYRPGDNRLGWVTGGVLRAECDAAGNLDLPTNMGAIVERDSTDQTVTTGTPTSISWDTEDRDIGGWIAVPGADLTVPSDGDGLYSITLEVQWESEASAAGERDLWIEAAGTAYGRMNQAPRNSVPSRQATSTIVLLSASDVVRGRVEHSQGGDSDVTYARLAIQKIA